MRCLSSSRILHLYPDSISWTTAGQSPPLPPGPTSSALREWIHQHAAVLGPVRWAVVVQPSARAAFGMARVGEALTAGSGITLRAFTDLQAAFAWVGGVEPAWD